MALYDVTSLMTDGLRQANLVDYYTARYLAEALCSVYCNRSCLWVCLCVGLCCACVFVGLLAR